MVYSQKSTTVPGKNTTACCRQETVSTEQQSTRPSDVTSAVRKREDRGDHVSHVALVLGRCIDPEMRTNGLTLHNKTRDNGCGEHGGTDTPSNHTCIMGIEAVTEALPKYLEAQGIKR
eukprot:467647-Prorocentrum_minimum.AAC.4